MFEVRFFMLSANEHSRLTLNKRGDAEILYIALTNVEEMACVTFSYNGQWVKSWLFDQGTRYNPDFNLNDCNAERQELTRSIYED